jgi:hypothetical protein
MLDKMSNENREQTETYLKSLWTQMLMDISASREMGLDELNDIADMWRLSGKPILPAKTFGRPAEIQRSGY